MSYLVPTDLAAALAGLARPGVQVIAGGTDWFPRTGERLTDAPLVDIMALPGFRGIAHGPDGWRIGAATSWTDILHCPLPAGFDALKLAAREVGSVQIQNAGTLAGNLCNASPAADGVPPLLAMDAGVELVSARGTRHLPLGRFILGPRRTALASGELVSAITVPDTGAGGRSTFIKAGARSYLVISIAMLAARIECAADGAITAARLAVGSCGPVACRLRALEALLIGATADTLPEITAADLPELAPLDDHRASATYRRAAVAEMAARALADFVGPR